LRVAKLSYAGVGLTWGSYIATQNYLHKDRCKPKENRSFRDLYLKTCDKFLPIYKGLMYGTFWPISLSIYQYDKSFNTGIHYKHRYAGSLSGNDEDKKKWINEFEK